MFAACLAAVAYKKEPGTKCMAPCIPGFCLSFLFPFFILRATVDHTFSGVPVGWRSGWVGGIGCLSGGVVQPRVGWVSCARWFRDSGLVAGCEFVGWGGGLVGRGVFGFPGAGGFGVWGVFAVGGLGGGGGGGIALLSRAS